MGENQQYVVMLVDILNKQLKTLEEILEVTKQQEVIATEIPFDNDKFEDTLSRKDVLIIRLNELDDGFSSVYSKVRRVVNEYPEQYREQVVEMQNVIRRCTDIGTEIKTLEIRNRDKLTKCFAGKKQEYSAKQAAATVANKYSVTMKNVNLMGEGYRFNQDK